VFGVAWFVTKAHRLVLVSTSRAVSASRRRLERVETTRLQKLSSSNEGDKPYLHCPGDI
jgi:hypothetical protein